MKRNQFPTVCFLLFLVCSRISAQEKTSQANNLIKVNLTSLPFKNFAFQYERILNQKISVAISFRTMPNSSLPFKNVILESSNDNQETKDAIESLRLNNTAITPEVRFYLNKKGYGKGIYIAPFYRYAQFEVTDMRFNYTNSLAMQSSIRLAGKLTAHTGGLLFGSQWVLGKHFCLDVWFLGPHYGAGNGNFSGTTTVPLTPTEQNEIRQELEDLDIPFTKKTVTVNANGASMKLDGPWGGVRSGISFGLIF